jgi:aminoglycoside phosphotransferase (APT) family kinase protein
VDDLDWIAPYLEPDAPVDGAGNYNRNFVVEHASEMVVVRVPICGAAALDFRVVPESIVLRVLEAQRFPAPRLLHADPAGRFVLHSFVPGTRLDALFPVRAPLPDWTAHDLARQLARLHQLDPAPLEPYCTSIPASPDGAALLDVLIDFTERAVAPLRAQHAWLYRRLHIPPDPLASVRAEARQLPPARFTICHCDVHRRNLIAKRARGANAPSGEQALTIIDWELALLGDPALDLAIHLHRMRYEPRQEALFLARYRRLRSNTDDTLGERIAIYRRHEQVRSALIDVARTVEDMREDLPPDTRRRLVEHYQIKLVRAWEIWGVAPDPTLVDTPDLLSVLEEAARRIACEE